MKFDKINQIAQSIDHVLSEFDKEFIRDASHEIKVILYTNLCEKDFQIADKEALQMIIESQVERLSAISPLERLKQAETINELIDDVVGGQERMLNKQDAFTDRFYQRRVDELYAKCDDSINIEKALIDGFLTNFDFKVNGAVPQVRYEDDDNYDIDTDNYEVRDDHGVSSMKRNVYDNQARHNDVRDLSDDAIAIDYEYYGYLVSKELNPEFTSALLSQFQQSKTLKKELSDYRKDNKEFMDIASTLADLCNDLSAVFAQRVEIDIIKAGFEIASVANCYMHNADKGIRNTQLQRVKDALSNNRVARDCVIEFIERVYDSKESLQQHKAFKLDLWRQRLASVNEELDEIDKSFDQNVSDALEHHNSGNSFMFKTTMNGLSAFEKSAVMITINHDKYEDKGLVADTSNVVAFTR